MLKAIGDDCSLRTQPPINGHWVAQIAGNHSYFSSELVITKVPIAVAGLYSNIAQNTITNTSNNGRCSLRQLHLHALHKHMGTASRLIQEGIVSASRLPLIFKSLFHSACQSLLKAVNERLHGPGEHSV